MTLYSDLPGRRLLQVVGDLVLLAWVVLWVSVARATHDATLALGAPGREVQHSAHGMAGHFRDLGQKVSGVPLVGHDLQSPFVQAGHAADQLAAAGHAQSQAVTDLAFWLGLAVGVIPIVLLAVVYVPPRIRFVRRASAARQLVDRRDGLDLLALRALARQPLRALARVDEDPAAAWRRGDQEVLTRLADLELASIGLRRTAGADSLSPGASPGRSR